MARKPKWIPDCNSIESLSSVTTCTGNVVQGLKEVVDVIGDPDMAWIFLTQEWPFENSVARPLELLKNGQIDDVLNAAPGFGTTFT